MAVKQITNNQSVNKESINRGNQRNTKNINSNHWIIIKVFV